MDQEKRPNVFAHLPLDEPELTKVLAFGADLRQLSYTFYALERKEDAMRLGVAGNWIERLVLGVQDLQKQVAELRENNHDS